MKYENIIGLFGLALLFILMVLFIIIIIVQLRKRTLQFNLDKEIAQNTFTQNLLQTQIEIQEQTLTNISQELHDNIGQTLSLAKLNLATIKLNNIDAAQQTVATTKELIAQSLLNIRDLAKSMLGEKIAEIGLQNALQNELNILQHTGKYDIVFNGVDETLNLTQQQQLVAFRILQEALHNIVKHADATHITVTILQTANELSIKVIDNGRGFNYNNTLPNNSGVGIKNMYSRAALVQAICTFTQNPTGGTTLNLIFMS